MPDTALPALDRAHTLAMANCIRALAMDAVEAAKSGHPGMPMGMADAATVLFTRHLVACPSVPDWPDRDRFVLSAGHGSMLLYALGYLMGWPAMSLDQLRRFRQMGSRTPGHPERDLAIGVETTTGPLGQGFGTAVGMALAERMLAARFGDGVVDHWTYVIASDGDLMEGINHESASLAAHLGLGRLIVLFDDNGISIDGPTSLSVSEDTQARYRAYGWRVLAVDGHDPVAVDQALAEARHSQDRPVLIATRTTIGYGSPGKAGTSSSHGSPLGAQEVAAARAQLGWSHGPFEIPDDLLAAWRAAGARHQDRQQAWQQRLAALPPAEREAFTTAIAGAIPAAARQALVNLARVQAQAAPKIATRAASGQALEALLPALPTLVGGSADLTGSNLTHVKGTQAVRAGDWSGRYLHFGIREHAMAAAMNGMALHGGVVPYGGTFLTFSDYCRPAIRLAALMRARVIHVMTHDSIGLGEDGPTHQPVEHLAALRAIPNTLVLRPADAVETAEAWAVALDHSDGPSILALSRQNLPTLRQSAGDDLPTARGGYVLRAEAAGTTPRVVLVASGSEVEIAVAVAEALAADGIAARVVSMPCLELFRTQGDAARADTLGPETALRVVIEAGLRMGWDGIVLRPGDLFCGMTGFGESGPYQALYEHYGLTAAAIAPQIRARLGQAG